MRSRITELLQLLSNYTLPLNALFFVLVSVLPAGQAQAQMTLDRQTTPLGVIGEQLKRGPQWNSPNQNTGEFQGHKNVQEPQEPSGPLDVEVADCRYENDHPNAINRRGNVCIDGNGAGNSRWQVGAKPIRHGAMATFTIAPSSVYNTLFGSSR